MLKIGLTGGIGAGKSTVSRILTSMNYPVFSSDLEARRITQEHPQVRETLIANFGPEIFQGAQLNRPMLAKIIFQDADARKLVNDLIHPLVREAFSDWCEKQSSPLVFNEAAILFETGAYRQFDRTVLVTAPEELRIRRVVRRDKTTNEAVLARMRQQWTDEEKLPLANVQIVNDDQHSVLKQTEEMLEYFLAQLTSS